jgi:peptidoglycan/xylan/chitin deacetylase (PgdA/CDA1 family)
MGRKNIKVGYGVDVDAVAGWIGSYGGEDSPCDISRGLFAGEVGVPRLLNLFGRFGIKTTWFIPGHSIETFPQQMKRVVDEGHEVGIHGYSHENPLAMTPKQEEKVLLKAIGLLEELSGKRPAGYVAPWWEFSKATTQLLLKHSVKYDHSLMHNDFHCYYVRAGDRWYPIDYGKDPDEWMKPFTYGRETDLIEIPANWYLDDLPPMMFIKKAANSFGWISPDVIFKLWKDQFDFMYREYDDGILPMTIHPDVSGRPQCILMHERLIRYIKRHPGVTFCTMKEIADDFATKNPPPSRRRTRRIATHNAR